MAVFGRIALAGLLATGLSLRVGSAHAAVFVAESGESHDSTWRSSDIGLFIDSGVAALPDFEIALAQAITVWQRGDDRLPRVWPIWGNADELGYRAGSTNRNTVRFAASGEPKAKGALAVTLVSYDAANSVIVDGDIVVNGLYKFANIRTAVQSGQLQGGAYYDITDVIAHEMGHWFGLADDLKDPTALMYPYFDPGVTRTLQLSEGDKQAMDALYSARTSTPGNASACTVSGVGKVDHEGRTLALLVVSMTLILAVRTRRGGAS